MKTHIYLLSLALMISLVSCDELAEKIEVGFRTNIEADIPVTTLNAMTIDLKSVQVANDTYTFIGGSGFSLAEIPELKKYMEDLRSITAEKGSVIKFTGAADGNKIMSLKIKFGMQIIPETEPVMITVLDYTGEILADAGEISYFNDAWSPVLIGALDANRDKIFIVKVEGTSNYIINSSVKVKIPVKVSGSPL